MLRFGKHNFMILFSIAMYLVSSASPYAASFQEFDETFAAEIDEFVLHEMKAGNIPGLAIGIVNGDRVIYLKGYGTAGPGKGDVTPETAFVLGSVSKSFTGLAILKLSEEGLLNLNDPVKKYIPWFSMGGSSASGSITIIHLLNHTSGIPAYYGNDSGIEQSERWRSG